MNTETMQVPAPSLALYLEMSDDQLGDRIINRDQTAMTIFHRRHENHVFGKAWRAGASEDTANTIVSESMLAVWMRADRFDPNRGNFRMFFWGIVKHRISNELTRERAQKRRMIIPDSDALDSVECFDDPADHLRRQEIKETLDEVILSMKPHRRLAFRLFHFEGYSLKEISRILKRKQSSVGSDLMAARERIRRSFSLRNLIEVSD